MRYLLIAIEVFKNGKTSREVFNKLITVDQMKLLKIKQEEVRTTDENGNEIQTLDLRYTQLWHESEQ